MVDTGNDVGRVQHDADDDCPMDELAEKRQDDSGCLAHDEDDGNEEKRPGEPTLPDTSPGTGADPETGDVLGVDEQDKADVENEDDDDNDVADGELNNGGNDRSDL